MHLFQLERGLWGQSQGSRLEQHQRLGLCKKALAVAPQSLLCRHGVQTQLHSALRQSECSLRIKSSQLLAGAVQGLQKEDPVRKCCIDFLGPSKVSAPIAQGCGQVLDRGGLGDGEQLLEQDLFLTCPTRLEANEQLVQDCR